MSTTAPTRTTVPTQRTAESARPCSEEVVSTPRRATHPVAALVDTALARISPVLDRHSIPVLRMSLGLVFLAFGAFKFFPGASPAEELAVATVTKLTLGMVHGGSALLMTAVMETIIGLTLLTGRFVKVGLAVLATALVGIMSPLVLFADQMWGSNGPTLTGQYVFKDVVLAAAGLVVAAHALGSRLRPATRR